jgi:hypothetical protein
MDALRALRDPLQKYTGFRLPDAIKTLATSCLTSLHKKSFSVPICPSDSPVVRLLSSVLSTPKLLKVAPTIVGHVVDCLGSDCFSIESIQLIVHSVVPTVLEIDCNSLLQLVQYSVSGIQLQFPDLALIHDFFSIVLSATAHSNAVVSSTSMAVFAQLMQLLIDSPSRDSPRFLEECSTLPLFARFSDPLHCVVNALFVDLSEIAAGRGCQWLTAAKPPVTVAYDLLELAVSSNVVLLRAVAPLLAVLEGAVIQGLNDPQAVHFVIAFLEGFLEQHRSLCVAVFSDYLSRISAKSRLIHIPLFFFRCIATRTVGFAVRVFLLCDLDNTMFLALVRALVDFCEPNAPSKPPHFSIAHVKVHDLDQKFVLVAPYEILFGLLRSFDHDTDRRIATFLEESSTLFVKSILFVFKYSSLNTFSVPCDAFLTLLKLLRKFSLPELRNCLDIISTLHFNEQMPSEFEFAKKRELWYDFLLTFANANPGIFAENWDLLVLTLSSAKITLPETFTKNFTDEELTQLVTRVLTVRPLFREFVCHILLVNRSRFAVIWSIFKAFFTEHLKKKEMEDDVLRLFLDIIIKSICSETESSILEWGLRFVASGSNLQLRQKNSVLVQIRQILSENIMLLKQGWSSLFQILSPFNYNADLEILQTSFGVLSLICNDFFNLVPQNSLAACVRVIFQFAGCQADINLSLSSFDLLWVVVRVFENTSDNWLELMNELTELIHSNRPDVAQCAIRTFLNLMSSNFEQIPSNVFDYLIDSGFICVINGCTEFPDLLLALQELAHYTATFWEKFSRRSTFQSKYLPVLIEKQLWFTLNCDNHEWVTCGFQVFECLFQCPFLNSETEDLLRDSIMKINEHFLLISDMNCIIFACWGRTLGRLLLSLKQRNALGTISLWFPLLRRTCTVLKSLTHIHITVHRALEPIPGLCPMPPETTFMVLDFMLELGLINDQPPLREYLCGLMIPLFGQQMSNEDKLKFVVKCTPLFEFAVAEPLMRVVLEAGLGVTQEFSDAIFTAFSLIAKTCPDLADLADPALIAFFNQANKDDQKQFVIRNAQKFDIVSLIWVTFFNIDSEKFNSEVFENCFELVLRAVSEMLTQKESAELVLQFLLKCHVPAKKIGGHETNDWFVLKLMPRLVELIMDDSQAIRARVRELLAAVSPVVTGTLE